MKITPEDMDAVREAVNMTMAEPHRYEERDTAIALILVRIYDRGYGEALKDHRILTEEELRHACPYTHAHTRHWCGYDGCRDS